MWGSTVAAAAAQRARSLAAGATALEELTGLVERCLLADLRRRACRPCSRRSGTAPRWTAT